MLTKQVRLSSSLLSGSGNLTPTKTGGLFFSPNGQEGPARDRYKTEVGGVQQYREITPGGVPWVSQGKMLVQLSDVQLLGPAAAGMPVVEGFTLLNVDTLGQAMAPYDPALVDVELFTEAGAYLAGSTDATVGLVEIGDAVRFPAGSPSAQESYDPASKTAVQGVAFSEGAELTSVKKVLMHKPTSTRVAGTPQTYYSALSWAEGPVQNGQRLWITVGSAVSLGIDEIILNTAYGRYRAKLRATEGPNITSAAPAEYHWITRPAPIPQYGTTRISSGSIGFYSVAKNLSLDDWKAKFTVYAADGRVLASGVDRVDFEGGSTFTVELTGTSPAPVTILSLDLLIEYDLEVLKPPPPLTGGAVFVDPVAATPEPFGRAAVPQGALRIVKHPLMPVGCNVKNQLGVPVSWESPSFLLLPQGTTSVTWDQVARPLTKYPARGDLPTARVWGDCQISQTNTVPGEIETNFGSSSGVRTYTPKVEVIVGGLDATLDLTSAGGGQVSYEGDFDLMTGQIPAIDGNDMLIKLDGVVIEWHKIVDYHRSTTENGVSVTVSGVDPLDYHNVDIDSLYKSQPTTIDARKDLAAYVTDIANHAGLKLSGNAELAFPATSADTEGDDAYTWYGNTVTQELELAANACLCTVVTDAPSQTVYFLPLSTIKAAAQSPATTGPSCAFISEGYSLGEGYATVEVGGVSNTLSVDTKVDAIPVIKIGSNGAQSDFATNINTFSGKANLSGDGQDLSMWWPDATIPEAHPDSQGRRWIEFQALEDTGEVTLYPVPLIFNKGGLGSTDPAAKYKNGGVMKLGDPGAPTLIQPAGGDDPRKVYWITAKTALSTGSGPINSWKIGEMQRGYYYISEIEFRVETPAQIRQRLNLSTQKMPDSFGPCITGFRCYIKDEGLYGYSVYFRLGFNANVIDESRVSLLPFICSPTIEAPAGKLPHKKVTVQNPFIVQERPSNTQWGKEPDLTQSASYKLGVQLANDLTRWEAMKRYSGEVKFLGGKAARIGTQVEGQTVIAQPTAQIVPGEACWTVLKTSSYKEKA
ncbi:hypothetical protein Dxin01_00170 [Deinococcus xinjiangensis]|uniref:Tip attachment protein J domain-containing protein n=1 Tax=Deinococcus xinjiangensis TaxID=457454 RepID=A0ABP9V591_9DEIO